MVACEKFVSAENSVLPVRLISVDWRNNRALQYACAPSMIQSVDLYVTASLVYARRLCVLINARPCVYKVIALLLYLAGQDDLTLNATLARALVYLK